MEYSLEQLSKVANQVIDVGRRRRPTDGTHATLITFSGDLGAGKTTLIQEIAQQLGVSETLQSPTFVIYKRYEIFPTTLSAPPPTGGLGTSPLAGGGNSKVPWKNFIHGDMYRLESSAEIKKLGWHELINNPENIICIEWPEKIIDAIPDWAIRISINYHDNQRIVDID